MHVKKGEGRVSCEMGWIPSESASYEMAVSINSHFGLLSLLEEENTH
jgi:hypothetical protein